MKTSVSRLPPPVWGWVGGGVRWAPWDSSPSPPPQKKGKKKVISHPKLMQLKGREPGKKRDRQRNRERAREKQKDGEETEADMQRKLGYTSVYMKHASERRG